MTSAYRLQANTPVSLAHSLIAGAVPNGRGEVRVKRHGKRIVLEVLEIMAASGEVLGRLQHWLLAL